MNRSYYATTEAEKSMNDEHSGYIFDITAPTKQGFVARLVITPKNLNNSADTQAKVERDLGREKAVEIATDLLERCGASPELLAQVQALASAS